MGLIWCFNSTCPLCHQVQVCPRSTRRCLWLTHNPTFFLSSQEFKSTASALRYLTKRSFAAFLSSKLDWKASRMARTAPIRGSELVVSIHVSHRFGRGLRRYLKLKSNSSLSLETPEGTKDRTYKGWQSESDRGPTTHHETQSQMHFAYIHITLLVRLSNLKSNTQPNQTKVKFEMRNDSRMRVYLANTTCHPFKTQPPLNHPPPSPPLSLSSSP